MVDQNTNKTSLFKKSGNQGDQWLQGTVQIQASAFKLQFISIAGNGRLGDMALDDFQFSPKVMPSCRHSEFTCENNGYCIMPSQVCDFHDDCPLKSDETRCGEFSFLICLFSFRSLSLSNLVKKFKPVKSNLAIKFGSASACFLIYEAQNPLITRNM